LRHLLGITKLHKEKNQCIREKTGAQDIVKEIKQYRGYNTYRGWTQRDYQSKHYNIDQKTKEHRTTEEDMEGPTSF
jgi:hypothetical protein